MINSEPISHAATSLTRWESLLIGTREKLNNSVSYLQLEKKKHYNQSPLHSSTYTAGQKFPDTWILFNFLIKTPIIISKKFKYHIYFIKDTYSYYLRKKKTKNEIKKIPTTLLLLICLFVKK